jgi:hypothetical protein
MLHFSLPYQYIFCLNVDQPVGSAASLPAPPKGMPFAWGTPRQFDQDNKTN